MPDLGGLYRDRFDISGEILQKISKTLYFNQNVEKNLLHVILVKIHRFDHVSDDIPVASFAVDFVDFFSFLWKLFQAGRKAYLYTNSILNLLDVLNQQFILFTHAFISKFNGKLSCLQTLICIFFEPIFERLSLSLPRVPYGGVL